jgi:malate synthase
LTDWLALCRAAVEDVRGVLAELPRTEDDRVDDAADVFRQVTLEETFPTFLTISAYSQYLVESAERSRIAA